MRCELVAAAKVRTELAKTMPSVMGHSTDRSPMRDPDTGKDISAAKRFTFADLRDTALTRLVLADCKISEVCAITGHKEDTALSLWKHDLAQRPEIAQSAGEKVAAWCEQNGIKY